MAKTTSDDEGRPLWKFVQSFGDDNSSSDDLVTSVEFDHSGKYLAVGDKAGRICIFEGVLGENKKLEYRFYTEFQSHEPEFDYLKSLELEETINQIKFLGQRQDRSIHMLATNDKTIKLWKVHEKKLKRVSRNVHAPAGPVATPRIPSLSHYRTVTVASCKQVYANAHGYHINSICTNCDGETFLSVDDLRINLWNVECSDTSFNIVDIKPATMEELTDVIICAALHPTNCSTLAYANSRGSVHLKDMRSSALCDSHSGKLFETPLDASEKTFFSDIVSSVCDVNFTQDGRYMLTRDYFSLKMWDLNMERSPVLTVPLHSYLEPYICDLYKNDCLFDSFECCSTFDGRQLLTGGYNNNFTLHDVRSGVMTTIEAVKDAPRIPAPRPPTTSTSTPTKASSPRGKGLGDNDTFNDSICQTVQDPQRSNPPSIALMDFGKKTQHVACHPKRNMLAVAGLNRLYVYRGD